MGGKFAPGTKTVIVNFVLSALFGNNNKEFKRAIILMHEKLVTPVTSVGFKYRTNYYYAKEVIKHSTIISLPREYWAEMDKTVDNQKANKIEQEYIKHYMRMLMLSCENATHVTSLISPVLLPFIEKFINIGKEEDEISLPQHDIDLFKLRHLGIDDRVNKIKLKNLLLGHN